MIDRQVNIETVNEQEYSSAMLIDKILFAASLATTGAGLVGLAANHFVSPESSELVREILNYGIPVTIFGAMFSLYSGFVYCANRNINSSSEK